MIMSFRLGVSILRDKEMFTGEGAFYPLVFAAAAKLPGGLVQARDRTCVSEVITSQPTQTKPLGQKP